VPDEDLTADFYVAACERLESAGIKQYEISNFACEKFESRHNLKYWTRQPYLGFGVDAHSMLFAKSDSPFAAVRFATSDSLDAYVAGSLLEPTVVSLQTALEETFFLRLRLNGGLDLSQVTSEFGEQSTKPLARIITDLSQSGLLEHVGDTIRLTPRGRLLSNEVFQRFIAVTV
jgi:oxygen-independent coproporphyrinogen-3 oxidase